MPARRFRAGGLVGPGRLPSDRRSTSLPSRARTHRCSATLARPAPLSPGTLLPPCHGGAGRPVLPDAVLAALAGAAGNAGKMPLTDFCNRPSARAPSKPLDSLASGRVSLAAPPSAERPFGSPGRLSTPSARVEGRLTPSFQLQPSSRRPPRADETADGPSRHAKGSAGPDRRFAAAAFSAARSARSSTSDVPSRPPVRPACAGRPGSQGRFRLAPVKEQRFSSRGRDPLSQAPSRAAGKIRLRGSHPWPGTSSLDRCSRLLGVAPEPPATRHRPRGVATPASRLPALHPAATPGALALDAGQRGAPPVDFCNHHGFRARRRT
jgi:hypothetical protein